MTEIDRNHAVELLRCDLVELVALVVGSIVDQHRRGRALCDSRRVPRAASRYLRIAAEGGQQIAGFRANFRRPDFVTIDQDLLASAEIVNDTPVAYHSRRGVALVGIERRFGPDLTAGIGLQGTKANVVPEANPNPMTASAPPYIIH